MPEDSPGNLIIVYSRQRAESNADSPPSIYNLAIALSKEYRCPGPNSSPCWKQFSRLSSGVRRSSPPNQIEVIFHKCDINGGLDSVLPVSSKIQFKKIRDHKNRFVFQFSAPVFDERDIREGLGDGCGHRVMIPLEPDQRSVYSGQPLEIPLARSVFLCKEYVSLWAARRTRPCKDVYSRQSDRR